MQMTSWHAAIAVSGIAAGVALFCAPAAFARISLAVSIVVVATALVLPTPALVALAGRSRVTVLENIARSTPWELPALIHFFAFAWIALLVPLACQRCRRLRMASFLTALAVVAELIQGLAPGRTPRLTDIGVNLLGATTGFGLAVLIAQVKVGLGRDQQIRDRLP
ncbi:VanZ family protein [Luteimonas fraxinea]|uniref:VanZ family protein n=1 Tax=Luteimonas fraxinea TaxID=2901869 RepID=A0ABS8UG71_9GAMM|nr:VanZ family protein [Luteimonas fraxinea]MCD9097668.1 VanZ family protein [Luteimonas fraxinea]MCD9124790.1 VanZ family protein [Luteimonas fraxinea]UHH08567.1 VanZ family protein [Luteimonas fraxinea]